MNIIIGSERIYYLKTTVITFCSQLQLIIKNTLNIFFFSRQDVLYESLGTSQTGNSNVYTEMLGGICPSKFGEISKGTYFALSTLNGM